LSRGCPAISAWVGVWLWGVLVSFFMHSPNLPIYLSPYLWAYYYQGRLRVERNCGKVDTSLTMRRPGGVRLPTPLWLGRVVDGLGLGGRHPAQSPFPLASSWALGVDCGRRCGGAMGPPTPTKQPPPPGLSVTAHRRCFPLDTRAFRPIIEAWRRAHRLPSTSQASPNPSIRRDVERLGAQAFVPHSAGAACGPLLRLVHLRPLTTWVGPAAPCSGRARAPLARGEILEGAPQDHHPGGMGWDLLSPRALVIYAGGGRRDASRGESVSLEVPVKKPRKPRKDQRPIFLTQRAEKKRLWALLGAELRRLRALKQPWRRGTRGLSSSQALPSLPDAAGVSFPPHVDATTAIHPPHRGARPLRSVLPSPS